LKKTGTTGTTETRLQSVRMSFIEMFVLISITI
jgi:hypothetical protein